jgi:hypothetical protein
MFDIKNAAEEASPSDLTLHFKYWVVFTSISRESWFGSWGSEVYAPPKFLFSGDLSLLADKIRADEQAILQTCKQGSFLTDTTEGGVILNPNPGDKGLQNNNRYTLIIWCLIV